MTRITEREKIIKKFEYLSSKYHKLSLLFWELSKSINFEIKKRHIERSRGKIKEYLKTLNLDFDKIEKISRFSEDINLSDLKKEVKDE